jgi:extensin-like protein
MIAISKEGIAIHSRRIAFMLPERCRNARRILATPPAILTSPTARKIANHVKINTVAAAGAGIIGTALIAGVASDGAAAQSALDPAPTVCQMRLSANRAVFKPRGELGGPTGCGGPDVVYLERIILPDRTEVAVEPPATLRCEMAEAVVFFVRQDLAPAAAAMGAPLSAIENYDSYDCRGRNRVGGAKLSEHGLANALDIRSIRLKDGRVVRPADSGVPREFRVAMKATVCNRFTTVLGPGSDGYHEDHIHMDRAERRGGYRLCQWDLHDGGGVRATAVQSAGTLARADVAAVPAGIPLPRPRPFVTGSRAIYLPAESHPR